MVSLSRRTRPDDDGDHVAPRTKARRPVRFTVTVGTVIGLVIALIVFWVWQAESFGSTDGGHVAIVRNGGPFDNTRIRQVLPASSGRTNIGMYSSMHDYPTSQRFYTISSSGHGDSDESIEVPTADGVQVGIEGTAYFTLNTSPADGYRVLKAFDNKYGTRTFRCTGGGMQHLYDGDTGFSCFLDQIVSPVINNDLRVSIGDLKCADLVASCSLVQNSSATQPVDPSKVGQGNVNLAKVEQDISSSLASDLNSTLGGQFFANVRFNLAKIDLDKRVQDAISAAQAKFAEVTASQADLKKAQIEAQTNAARQKGYDNCRTCQQIDILKSLPGTLTTLVLGKDGGVSLSVPNK